MEVFGGGAAVVPAWFFVMVATQKFRGVCADYQKEGLGGTSLSPSLDFP